MRGGRKWDLQVVNTNSEPSQDNSPLAQFVQVLNEYPEGAPRSELEKLGLVDSVLNGLMQEMEYGWNSDRSKIIKKEEA